MKLSLPIYLLYLLISDTLACVHFHYSRKETWKFTTGSFSDIDVVQSCPKKDEARLKYGSLLGLRIGCEPNTEYLKITNKYDKSTSIQIPMQTDITTSECDIEFHTWSKYSSVGITNVPTEDKDRASALLMPIYKTTPGEKSWVYAFSPRQKRNVNDCYNEDGCAKWKSVTLVESSDHVYKDLKVQLNTDSGQAQIYQKSESLLDFQCEAFKTDADLYLSIQIDAKDEYAMIKDGKIKDQQVPQTKLEQGQTKRKPWLNRSRNAPSSIVDLAETDFSIKNSALNNEFSVKNSTFDARDIVISVLVGLIAVLTSVAVYQYKGIETLKRVANGSDYQKM